MNREEWNPDAAFGYTIRFPWWCATDRQQTRYMARRYNHWANPWSSCNGKLRGRCTRCAWRTLTGYHRREKAKFLAFIREEGGRG